MSQRPDPLHGSPIEASDQARARELSDWAESDSFAISDDAKITHGATAAAEGRALLEAAIGADELEQATGRGRPRLGSSARRGSSPKRQVRLPEELDKLLQMRVEHDGRDASSIIRDALDKYLRV